MAARSAGRRHWAAVVAGGLLAIIGLILASGGAYLATLGGSLYYLLAGIGLLIAGVMILRGRVAGAWIYAAVFALTLVWAIWESGADPWAYVPRLVGPTVLLVMVALVAPLLDRRIGWGKALAGAALGVIASAAVIGTAAANQPAWVKGPLPAGPGSAPFRAAGSQWPAYGGTPEAQRFSALAQITPDNVGSLERAWTIHTGDVPSGLAAGKYASENTPLKIGDSLYMCTAMNRIVALDAATGAKRWEYDPKVSARAIPYSASCRGVTAYTRPDAAAGQQCAMRIIEGTLDGRLIAVDARTGQPCADFGTNGQVDIKQGMGTVYPGMVSITAPPVVVRGAIVTGHQVLDGQRADAPSGVIQAFDVLTGELRWAWDMGRPGQTGLPGPGEQYTRGTPNMWTAATGDERLGLVYLPMGNSAGDYYSSERSAEENRFSTALVALDATTGQPRWAFQTVHKDVWDYDLGSQASLIDLPGGVPAVVLPSKQGDIYILDRRTGQPLHGVDERPVPQGGVEPEQRSRTQPFSRFHTLGFPDLQERDTWGMSPIDQMYCRIRFREANYRGYFTPPSSDRPFIQFPGYNGGSDWGSIAIDPRRGVIVANYNNMPNYNRLVPRAEADRKGWKPRGPEGNQGGSKAEGAGDPQFGLPYAIQVNAGWVVPFTQMLCKEPPYGGIRAIDLMTGRTIWDRPFGTARANGPFGLPTFLPFEIGTPNNGGGVVTAGGLVFIAATTDNMISAIDVRTGRTLWQDRLPGGGQANVMTYEQGGRQYVVIAPGGHHFMKTPISDAVVAYALPRR